MRGRVAQGGINCHRWSCCLPPSQLGLLQSDGNDLLTQCSKLSSLISSMMGGRTSSLMIKAAFPITTVSDSCLAMCLRSLVCASYGFKSLKLEWGKGALSIQYTSLPASFTHNNMPGHLCKLPLFLPRERIATQATSPIPYTTHTPSHGIDASAKFLQKFISFCKYRPPLIHN